MTLTDKLKKGKLKDGWYYTQVGIFEEVSPDLYDKDDNSWLCDSDKDLQPLKVLAPVPSYEEWQELSKQRNQFIRDVNDLAYIQEENQQLKKDNRIFEEKIHNSYLKIGQLKELLKECKDIIEWYKADTGYVDLPTENLLIRINTVIGESEE